MGEEIGSEGPEGGSTMAGEPSHAHTGPGVAPEDHAARVAGDRHLVAQFYQYCVLGDTPDALDIVVAEAEEIRSRCASMPVTTPVGADRTLFHSMRSIEEVAERCDRRGDTVQAMWCRMLNHQLEGHR